MSSIFSVTLVTQFAVINFVVHCHMVWMSRCRGIRYSVSTAASVIFLLPLVAHCLMLHVLSNISLLFCRVQSAADILLGLRGSNPSEGIDVCLLWMLCVVEVCAMGRSLVQRSPADCGGVIVCDLETWRTRRPWPALGCCAKKKKCLSVTTTEYITVSLFGVFFVLISAHKQWNGIISVIDTNVFYLYAVLSAESNCQSRGITQSL
jgi:hypothetical protein